MIKHILQSSVPVMLLFVIAACFNPACAKERKISIKPLVKGNTNFALNIYSQMAGMKKGENVFFSPYSISSILALTYGGAKGVTADEMAKALRFSQPQSDIHGAFKNLSDVFDEIQQKGDVELTIANSLWPDKKFKIDSDYLSLAKNNYDVSISPLDYERETEASRKMINTWVEDKTKNKIQNLISQGGLDPSTQLVLVNAIYFKGNWKSPFNANRTRDSHFYKADTQKVPVKMMRQKESFQYYEDDTVQILELPYAGGQLAMVVVLPQRNQTLSSVEKSLSMDRLNTWLTQLRQQKVSVYFPRFKFTWGTFELNQSLKALGMRTAFEPKADFSGMTGTKNLYIGKVLHKAFVEVNEEGTEAAAATGVMMVKSAQPGSEKLYTFRADHPFIFFIRDKMTGSILFMGRVTEPVS